MNMTATNTKTALVDRADRVAVLRAVADQIEAFPEMHDQDTWGTRTACGTSHCIAGWVAAVTLPPQALLWEADFFDENDKPTEWILDCVDVDGKRAYISDYAQEVLGAETVDPWNSVNYLFSSAWEPKEDMTVPEALRALADGASLDDVSL